MGTDVYLAQVRELAASDGLGESADGAAGPEGGTSAGEGAEAAVVAARAALERGDLLRAAALLEGTAAGRWV